MEVLHRGTQKQLTKRCGGFCYFNLERGGGTGRVHLGGSYFMREEALLNPMSKKNTPFASTWASTPFSSLHVNI